MSMNKEDLASKKGMCTRGMHWYKDKKGYCPSVCFVCGHERVEDESPMLADMSFIDARRKCVVKKCPHTKIKDFDEYTPFDYITVNDINNKYNTISNKINKPVDPKQSCASKKMCFDAVSTTLQIIASEAAKIGADKYGKYNWLKLEDGTMSIMTYLNAAQRHWILYKAGQDYTNDSPSVHNLDAIIVGLSVVRDAMIFGKVKDDREKLTEEQIITLEKLINKEMQP